MLKFTCRPKRHKSRGRFFNRLQFPLDGIKFNRVQLFAQWIVNLHRIPYPAGEHLPRRGLNDWGNYPVDFILHVIAMIEESPTLMIVTKCVFAFQVINCIWRYLLQIATASGMEQASKYWWQGIWQVLVSILYVRIVTIMLYPEL